MSGDKQEFKAEEHSGREPNVTLLWMTPDPLGAVAAFAGMYEGRVVRSLSDLTHEDRMRALENTKATHLRAPLETVKLHFLIENVDRAFTHQLVRQRTAVYAQESLRFAVPEGLPTSLPPSLEGTHDHGFVCRGEFTKEERWRALWDRALDDIDETYHQLVADGMPAEEARGLLPHATLTRIQYCTDLRNLLEHAGNRLCTQAQFHWRTVYQQISQCIRNYWIEIRDMYDPGYLDDLHAGSLTKEFGAIADMFKPICYQLGRCPFQASFDRECTIRDRVRRFEAKGIPSDKWETPDPDFPGHHINREEWLADPAAARKT